MPILFNLLKLNPKMKVVPRQSVAFESFKILEAYRHKSEDPERMGSIIDLGGGGEGIVGQIMGRAVTAVDIREDELLEAPEGPFKVVADARALPFEADAFYCATAFYFLMYLKPEDFKAVFDEAFRVLKTSGRFVIWDATIPESNNSKKRLFVVPIRIAMNAGFSQEQNLGSEDRIHLVFVKA